MQFLVNFGVNFGVIKCLDNPYFTMCLLADTKKPHIKNFELSTTHPLKFSVVIILNPLQGLTTLHISCVPLTDALGLDKLKGKIPLDHLIAPTKLFRSTT